MGLESLRENREIELEIKGGDEDVVAEKWYNLQRGDEEYLIAFNSLPDLCKAEEWDVRITENSWPFRNLEKKLKEMSKNKVVAFFDIVPQLRSYDENEMLEWEQKLADYQQEQELKFHAFKHAYFALDNSAQNYMDLPITYDLLVV